MNDCGEDVRALIYAATINQAGYAKQNQANYSHDSQQQSFPNQEEYPARCISRPL